MQRHEKYVMVVETLLRWYR